MKIQLHIINLLYVLGDTLRDHAGSKFSTHDKDQDSHEINCALNYMGAWWYYSCEQR